MAGLISRLGFKKTECFSASESVQLKMNVGNVKDRDDENGQSDRLLLSSTASFYSDRDYFINLDTGKVSYMIPFMVKNEDTKVVGNS